MKKLTNSHLKMWPIVGVIGVAGFATASQTTAKTAPRKVTKARTTKTAAKVSVPAIFYDKEWSYRTATLYDKKKNIVAGLTGEAKFDRNGKYRQDYFISGIGNFFKGTYKIQGDHLITFDE